MLPPSSANSEGFTVTDLISTMLAFREPAALANFTPATLTLGVGSSDRLIGPSIARSRPVAFFTSLTAMGLYLLRSKKDGAISSATTSNPTTPPPPIKAFLRVDRLMISLPSLNSQTSR